MKSRAKVDNFGTKRWYLAGKLHRVDGPAVERASGGRGWWLAGRRFKSKESWFKSLSAGDKEKVLFSEHFITGWIIMHY